MDEIVVCVIVQFFDVKCLKTYEVTELDRNFLVKYIFRESR